MSTTSSITILGSDGNITTRVGKTDTEVIYTDSKRKAHSYLARYVNRVPEFYRELNVKLSSNENAVIITPDNNIFSAPEHIAGAQSMLTTCDAIEMSAVAMCSNGGSDALLSIQDLFDADGSVSNIIKLPDAQGYAQPGYARYVARTINDIESAYYQIATRVRELDTFSIKHVQVMLRRRFKDESQTIGSTLILLQMSMLDSEMYKMIFKLADEPHKSRAELRDLTDSLYINKIRKIIYKAICLDANTRFHASIKNDESSSAYTYNVLRLVKRFNKIQPLFEDKKGRSSVGNMYNLEAVRKVIADAKDDANKEILADLKMFYEEQTRTLSDLMQASVVLNKEAIASNMTQLGELVTDLDASMAHTETSLTLNTSRNGTLSRLLASPRASINAGQAPPPAINVNTSFDEEEEEEPSALLEPAPMPIISAAITSVRPMAASKVTQQLLDAANANIASTNTVETNSAYTQSLKNSIALLTQQLQVSMTDNERLRKQQMATPSTPGSASIERQHQAQSERLTELTRNVLANNDILYKQNTEIAEKKIQLEQLTAEINALRVQRAATAKATADMRSGMLQIAQGLRQARVSQLLTDVLASLSLADTLV